jgi:hypothetical protein
MAYSVMVWMVNPGEQAHEDEALERSEAGRNDAPGAAAGVNEPPAFTRMVYGVYETQEETDQALREISVTLQQNTPLRITMHGNRMFLVPASRVHYVVCAEVERPIDRQ